MIPTGIWAVFRLVLVLAAARDIWSHDNNSIEKEMQPRLNRDPKFVLESQGAQDSSVAHLKADDLHTQTLLRMEEEPYHLNKSALPWKPKGLS